LPPYSTAIHIRGGWPIAVIDPRGGTVLRISEWDEGKLIAAFRNAPNVPLNVPWGCSR
jgi:hypothetical protein